MKIQYASQTLNHFTSSANWNPGLRVNNFVLSTKYIQYFIHARLKKNEPVTI